MTKKPPQFSILGIPVHLLDNLDNYAGWLRQRLQQGKGTHVVTINPEMIMLAQSNLTLAQIIQEAELVVPDGAGVVLYLRFKGKGQKRCPGIELAGSLIEQAGKLGDACPVLFYGGSPGVAQTAARWWCEQVPGLSVTTSHGYLTTEAEEELKQTIQTQQPKLIMVGLGVPRQEVWISHHRHLAPDAVWIGVGGSFDIWSGVKSRAPEWLRDNHLEWLYRLYQEPWRWRRMLVLPQFALRVLVSH